MCISYMAKYYVWIETALYADDYAGGSAVDAASVDTRMNNGMRIHAPIHSLPHKHKLIRMILRVQDPFFITLQCLWLAFHSLRLLLIVEPCHYTSVEVILLVLDVPTCSIRASISYDVSDSTQASKTLKIVCKILRSRTHAVAVSVQHSLFSVAEFVQPESYD